MKVTAELPKPLPAMIHVELTTEEALMLVGLLYRGADFQSYSGFYPTVYAQIYKESVWGDNLRAEIQDKLGPQ